MSGFADDFMGREWPHPDTSERSRNSPRASGDEEFADLVGELASERARVESLLAERDRLRERTHEIQAEESQRRAKLQGEVERQRAAWAAAREQLKGFKADWTADPPGQEEYGWWRYTSENTRQAVALLAHDAEQARARVLQLEEGLRELLTAIDIERRYADCACLREGVDASCEDCLGTGGVVQCSRCRGTVQLGPEGDLNCPCGDGIDHDETERQVRFTQEHGRDFVTAATDRARQALQPIKNS